MKVYRSGTPTAPAQRGVEAESFLAADAVRPVGRQGRTDGIFASPTLEGVTRWVRGKVLAGDDDVFVRELTVKPEDLYVYLVREWERACSTGDYSAYWATGVKLEDWASLGEDPSEWEVLVSPEAIRTVRPVSDARVIGAERDEYYRGALARLLKEERKARKFAKAA